MPSKDLCPNKVTYTYFDIINSTCQNTAPTWDSRSLYDVFKDALKEEYVTKKSVTIPAIKRIVYHDPATIVFWQDGTKTVVKCMDGEPFEKYAGFCAALAKKVFGSTSKAKKVAGAKKSLATVYCDDNVIDRIATTNTRHNDSLGVAIDAFSNNRVAFNSKQG